MNPKVQEIVAALKKEIAGCEKELNQTATTWEDVLAARNTRKRLLRVVAEIDPSESDE